MVPATRIYATTTPCYPLPVHPTCLSNYQLFPVRFHLAAPSTTLAHHFAKLTSTLNFTKLPLHPTPTSPFPLQTQLPTQIAAQTTCAAHFYPLLRVTRLARCITCPCARARRTCHGAHTPPYLIYQFALPFDSSLTCGCPYWLHVVTLRLRGHHI